jgi:hypothetical protein
MTGPCHEKDFVVELIYHSINILWDIIVMETFISRMFCAGSYLYRNR